MNTEWMQKYADFVVRVGVNVRPGQYFFIGCPLDCAEFGRACAKAGFAAGARDVIVRYEDEKLQRVRYEHAAEEVLSHTMPYELRSFLDYAEAPGGACRLAIYAEDPEAFAGLDMDKINRVTAARSKAMRPWMDYTMNDRLQWCVASAPSPAWALRVFPDASPKQAVEQLWQAIFNVCRVTGGNPVAEWRAHVAKTAARRDILNAMKLDRVRFQSGNGTDLTVGLAQDSVWEGAAGMAENGTEFIANVPTEEVFTAPDCGRVEGVVYGTRPFVYNGQLIDGWRAEFHEGKVVAHSARKNGEAFGRLLQTDEGACRIGEVALVPASSPINQSGLLFYNTLFDENAACHIAFGEGYPTNIVGGRSMTREQLAQKGLNDSVLHEDVMIGAADTTVTGFTKDGREEAIFCGGEWAF